MMNPASNSILSAIGQTPLIALDRLTQGFPGRILAKAEYLNPGASIKDRIALKIIEEAEKSGKLKPGGTVVELTSGNTGIGLAIVCAVKGYRLITVMSAGNTPERAKMLRALGAEVVLVPQAPGSPPGQVSGEDLARVEERTQQIVEETKAFRADQFYNPHNPEAQELTGEEIWQQTSGQLDAFVAIVGTGGTFIGVSRALKRHKPEIQCFAVEPASAPVLAGKPIINPNHKIQGAGYSMIPPLWDSSLCDGYLSVTDEEAITMARRLARQEGIFAGFSSGANVTASFQLLQQHPEWRIATVLPDSGLKYLSTDLWEG